MAVFRRDRVITEEFIEVEGLKPDICKKLKGSPTADGRCMVRLESDDQNPTEAHLKKVNFKPAGQFLDNKE